MTDYNIIIDKVRWQGYSHTVDIYLLSPINSCVTLLSMIVANKGKGEVGLCSVLLMILSGKTLLIMGLVRKKGHVFVTSNDFDR